MANSTVKLWLEVDCEIVDVSQVGEGTLILREERDMDSREAILVIDIDGRAQRCPILITAVHLRVVSFEDAR